MRILPSGLQSPVMRLICNTIKPRSEDIEVELDGGCKMLVDLEEFVGWQIYMRGLFQPYLVSAIRKHLSPGKTFFDIGAHFGQFSLIAALEVGSNGSVHAFEPGPSQFRYLKHNVAANSLENIVRANELALGKAKGTVGFAEVQGGNLAASFIAEAADQTTQVEMTTIDSYCDENRIEAIDAIKIDVEGVELDVFKGAAETLSKNLPTFIAYENDDKHCKRYGYESSDLHELIFSYGYRIFGARGNELLKDQLGRNQRQDDFIALQNNREP